MPKRIPDNPRRNPSKDFGEHIQEVKARGGPVICVAPESADIPEDVVDDLIRIPDCHEAMEPILATIPLQLLSYYIACKRGCDVGQTAQPGEVRDRRISIFLKPIYRSLKSDSFLDLEDFVRPPRATI